MVLKQDESVWITAFAARGVRNYFTKVIPSGETAVAAGFAFSMVLRQDGGIWAMGRNYKGQLGDGT